MDIINIFKKCADCEKVKNLENEIEDNKTIMQNLEEDLKSARNTRGRYYILLDELIKIFINEIKNIPVYSKYTREGFREDLKECQVAPMSEFSVFKDNFISMFQKIEDEISGLKNENGELNKKLQEAKEITKAYWDNKLNKFYENQLHKRKKELDINLILKMKEEGCTNVKIAKELGVTEGTIRNRLKEIKKMRV